MMLLLAAAVVFVLLVVSEIFWRQHERHGEFTRKFVHITVGTFVAFWPYFMTRREILILSLAFLVVVGLSKQFNIFQAIHSVQRPTSGELWFALTVCILALWQLPPAIYTTALLEMSLADGFAAVLGTRYGKNNTYDTFRARKSVVGTLVFFGVSLVILLGYNTLSHGHSIGGWAVPLAALATLLENFGGLGFDNLMVPLAVAGLLRLAT